MRILLTNAVVLNGGDAAITIAALRLIERAFPGAKVRIVDSRADVARRLYPGFEFVQSLTGLLPRGRRLSLAMLRLRIAARVYRRVGRGAARLLCTAAQFETLDELGRADLVVSTGGTYLVEHYNLRTRRFELQVCQRLHKPLVFLTQSLGPFSQAINRRFFRHLFDTAPLALLRDRVSEKHLRDIGVRSQRLHVLPDVVFALAEPEVLRDAAMRPALASGTPRIAISVRAWSHFSGGSSGSGMDTYKAAVAALVEHLVATRQAEVTFLSTCQGVPEYAYDDAAVANEIHATLSPAARRQTRVDAGFHTPEALLEALCGFDCVVATRMHMAIMSLIAGTLVLPIAYEFKTRELFNELGFGKSVVAIEDATPERLIAAAEGLFERVSAPEARARLFAEVERSRQGAWRAAELLAAVR